MAPPAQREQARANIVVALRRDIEDAQAQSFDLDEMVDAVLDGVEAKRNGSHEVFWTEPGRVQVAVTTDAAYFENNADSLELWSPGGGGFPAAADVEGALPLATNLDGLLG